MLFGLDGQVCSNEFHGKINSLMAPYSCKIEDARGDVCEFFDFEVYKGELFSKNRQFDVRPVLRDAGLLLNASSAHLTSTHVH